jgi:hypothetical protein
MEIPANFERVTSGLIKRGDLIDFEFAGVEYAYGYIGCSVGALGFKVYRKNTNKEPASIKDVKHWNPKYSDVIPPKGYRFLESGEMTEWGDQCIDYSNRVSAIRDFSKVGLDYLPIIREIKKNTKKEPAPINLKEENARLNSEIANLREQLKTAIESGVREQKELALLKAQIRSLIS